MLSKIKNQIRNNENICKNKLITIVIEFENEFKSFINYIDLDNRLVQNTYYNKRFEKYFYVNSDKILIDFEILVFNPNGINSKFELKILDDNKTIYSITKSILKTNKIEGWFLINKLIKI